MLTGVLIASMLTLAAPAAASFADDSALTRGSAASEGGALPAVETPATAPTITGTVKVGSTLTAHAGDWQPEVVLSYQWLANGVAVGGATARTFIPAAAQRGAKLSVRVTGSLDGHADTTATSASTAAVAAGTLTKATPTITGTVAVGSTLTATPGTWTGGTSFTYQWYANGKAVSKATSRTHKVTAAQLGSTFRVKVTGKKAGYTTVSLTSKATAKAPKVSTPSVTGSARVGVKLSAKKGTWTTGTSFSYQWYANGKAISKATKSTYTVSSARVGSAISVKVTGKKSGYATVAKTSKVTRTVPKTATPKISGASTVTRTLTVTPGAWTKGTTFTYRWYANGKAIAKANKKSMKLTTKMVGKQISVKVTGKKAGYTTVSKTSKKSSRVGYPSRTTPSSAWNCPAWAPIKGNASSMIYHMPGQRFYKATKPEECFRTQAAARSAGYRKAKV